jgi:4-hydroxy-2-oxoheptanedioate aldolase
MAVPKRINRAIDLLEQGQPLYTTGVHELSYASGKAMAQTWADYITVEMEHAPFDVAGLAAFMTGLAAGGPTNSGHRTPAVITTLPVDGSSEAVMRANAWMVRQVLATGVHGILLCHAEAAGAVGAFVESCRFALHTLGQDAGLGEGRRGAGGQASAAKVWGIDPVEYIRRADPWPLNPEGELLLGLKVENRRALANAGETLAVPGVAFAEWGPGDMGIAFGHYDAHDPPYPADMDGARVRVLEACAHNNVAFLCSWNDRALTVEQRVRKLLDDGVKILSGFAEDGARIGREITNREMPV